MDRVADRSLIIPPYGGRLVNLVLCGDAREEVVQKANHLPSVQLSARFLCDLELLATGGFSPLSRFMGKEDHDRVLDDMRLAGGHVFPIPVTLTVEPSPAFRFDQEVALRNEKNELLAVMTVEEIYEWDRAEVSQKVFGTQDVRHPLVAEMHRWGQLNIPGRILLALLPLAMRLAGDRGPWGNCEFRI